MPGSVEEAVTAALETFDDAFDEITSSGAKPFTDAELDASPILEETVVAESTLPPSDELEDFTLSPVPALVRIPPPTPLRRTPTLVAGALPPVPPPPARPLVVTITVPARVAGRTRTAPPPLPTRRIVPLPKPVEPVPVPVVPASHDDDFADEAETLHMDRAPMPVLVPMPVPEPVFDSFIVTSRSQLWPAAPAAPRMNPQLVIAIALAAVAWLVSWLSRCISSFLLSHPRGPVS